MILLDPGDRRPIYEQIVEKLSALMIRGVLGANSPLPSVRTLAAELSINPNTVQRAYLELDRLGYIYTVKGKGSYVSDLGKIKEVYMNSIKQEFHGYVSELKGAGLREAELCDVVHDVYKDTSKGGDEDDRS